MHHYRGIKAFTCFPTPDNYFAVKIAIQKLHHYLWAIIVTFNIIFSNAFSTLHKLKDVSEFR